MICSEISIWYSAYLRQRLSDDVRRFQKTACCLHADKRHDGLDENGSDMKRPTA